MSTAPLYIFDLDGTLADLKHRRHFVERQELPCMRCGTVHSKGECPVCGMQTDQRVDWNAFHAACVNDTPIDPVINVLNTLLIAGVQNDANEIWVWSGRSDAVEIETRAWLAEHTSLDEWHFNWQLKMRKHGDYTPDDQLKESWLHAMSPEDRARLVMTFDDRDRVVAMWRRNGVVCAQVAPGDF